MLIFEANLEQRPAAVFRLNLFSCFPMIRLWTKIKKKTFGSINFILNRWGLNKIWHLVGNHTQHPHTPRHKEKLRQESTHSTRTLGHKSGHKGVDGLNDLHVIKSLTNFSLSHYFFHHTFPCKNHHNHDDPRPITAGGHNSADQEYLIFRPPPSYYQHPRPSSDARRSSAAASVGPHTVHFHSGGEREHFQLDRRFVCGHGRRHNPPSASEYLRLHNRRRWAVWTAEMWVYIINLHLFWCQK